MKAQTLSSNATTSWSFFGRPATQTTYNPTSARSPSTVATTHDHKEVTVKTQITNHSNDTIRSQRGKNRNTWRLFSLAVMVLLITASHASAQAPQCKYGKPNICSNYNGQLCGYNLCPATQYRSGSTGALYPPAYNADLTGSPFGGGATGLLNNLSVRNLALKYPAVPAPGGKGCGAPVASGGVLNPTTSPSINLYTVFPADDGAGNCALYTYSTDGFLVASAVIGPDTTPVTSSPLQRGVPSLGVPTVVASEDGNVYAYYSGTKRVDWTFTDYLSTPIDASPILALNSSGQVDAIYAVDIYGTLYRVSAYSGQYSSSTWPPLGSVFANIYPGGVNPGSGIAGTYAPSASSVAVSTCGASGLYSPCTMLFVAGSQNPGSGPGAVAAFDSANGTLLWQNATPPNPIVSSPVVSDSQGLVYVQDSEGILYALDQNPNGSGRVVWSTSLVLPNPGPPYYEVVYPYGGSPAYDDAPPNGGANAKYVITFAGSEIDKPCCRWNYQTISQSRTLTVSDATRSGKGAAVCSVDIQHPVTQSSPEVVNGVIYIGTNDGYVLAYDEATCISLWKSPQMVTPASAADPVVSPPVVSFNRVFVVTQSGTLYVYGIPGS